MSLTIALRSRNCANDAAGCACACMCPSI